MCSRANMAWSGFFAELAGADVGTLSARLGFFQPTIENIFESRALGESLMAWTAFANLFDTQSGWGQNEARAYELVAAFAQSNCSPEVKSEARAAAISYELERPTAPPPPAPADRQSQRRWR